MERLFDFKNTIDDSPKTVARHFMKKYRPALLAKKKHRMTAVKLTDDQMANIGDQIIKQAEQRAASEPWLSICTMLVHLLLTFLRRCALHMLMLTTTSVRLRRSLVNG